MKEIILYKSPLKSLRIFLISLACVVATLYFVSGRNRSWIWWLGLCLFGGSFVVSLINMLDRSPQITLNKTGVSDKTTHQGMVPWEMIKEAYELDIASQSFICLVTDERFVLKQKLYKWAENIDDAAGAQKVNLYVSKLKADPKKLLALIDALRNAPIEERDLILDSY